MLYRPCSSFRPAELSYACRDVDDADDVAEDDDDHVLVESGLVLVVKGRFTRCPPSRHHDNRPDSNLVESSILERGLEG